MSLLSHDKFFPASHHVPKEEPEEIHVCVVVMDLVGSTKLAHRLSLGEYARHMSHFVEHISEFWRNMGATVLHHQGDAVIGYWPFANAHLAIDAALQTQAEAYHLSEHLETSEVFYIRGGVAAGHIMVQASGNQVHAYGLPINLARRLCDAAPQSDCLFCEQIARWSYVNEQPYCFHLCLDFPHFAGFEQQVAFQITTFEDEITCDSHLSILAGVSGNVRVSSTSLLGKTKINHTHIKQQKNAFI